MTRTFELTHHAPYGTERTDVTVQTWAELQSELHLYCPAGVVLALDLAWIRPTPLTKGAWTIQERAA